LTTLSLTGHGVVHAEGVESLRRQSQTHSVCPEEAYYHVLHQGTSG